LLAQQVVAKYHGKVIFENENFGASKLAERFRVKRYPALFVDDVLVARPRDFGFFGLGEKSGRYTPWRSVESQERFKADLTRVIDLILAGKKNEVLRESAEARAAPPDRHEPTEKTLDALISSDRSRPRSTTSLAQPPRWGDGPASRPRSMT